MVPHVAPKYITLPPDVSDEQRSSLTLVWTRFQALRNLYKVTIIGGKATEEGVKSLATVTNGWSILDLREHDDSSRRHCCNQGSPAEGDGRRARANAPLIPPRLAFNVTKSAG